MFRLSLLLTPACLASRELASRHLAWADIKSYNQELSVEVPKWSTSTSPVYLVDQYSTFKIDQHTEDGVHFNLEGSNLVARNFGKAIKNHYFSKVTADTATKEEHNVMLLGDSLTAWNYRYALWFQLTTGDFSVGGVGPGYGYNLNFVGNQRSTSTLKGQSWSHYQLASNTMKKKFDAHYEAYPGYTTEKLKERVCNNVKISALASSSKPDVVVIMIGTNDFGKRIQGTIRESVENVEETIECLRRRVNPEVTVFVAQIPPLEEELVSSAGGKSVVGVMIVMVVMGMMW